MGLTIAILLREGGRATPKGTVRAVLHGVATVKAKVLDAGRLEGAAALKATEVLLLTATEPARGRRLSGDRRRSTGPVAGEEDSDQEHTNPGQGSQAYQLVELGKNRTKTNQPSEEG